MHPTSDQSPRLRADCHVCAGTTICEFSQVEKAKTEGYRVVTLLVFREGDFQWVAVRIVKS